MLNEIAGAVFLGWLHVLYDVWQGDLCDSLRETLGAVYEISQGFRHSLYVAWHVAAQDSWHIEHVALRDNLRDLPQRLRLCALADVLDVLLEFVARENPSSQREARDWALQWTSTKDLRVSALATQSEQEYSRKNSILH